MTNGRSGLMERIQLVGELFIALVSSKDSKYVTTYMAFSDFDLVIMNFFFEEGC
jgi:hypothetical protein